MKKINIIPQRPFRTSEKLRLIPALLLIMLALSCSHVDVDGTMSLPRGMTVITVPDRAGPEGEDPEKKAAGDETDPAGEKNADKDAVPGAGSGTIAGGAEKKDQPPAPEKKAERVREIEVDVYIPNNGGHKGDLLVLPGWNFSRKRWHQETDLLDFAEKEGLRMVFPEMKTTLYESEYFPETAVKWADTPGGRWITKTLIPHLQNRYGIFLEGHKNFILGLSTGGRGAVATMLDNPDLFTAGAALSGDFNQLAMPKDRLITAVYGPYRKFVKRWYAVDNPEVKIITGTWNSPLYIGHGKMDRIVPFEQSKSLHDAIVRYHPKAVTRFSAPEKGGHDFNFWKSEVPKVIAFFLEQE